MEATKFSKLSVGDYFEIHNRDCIKLDNSHYRILSTGAIRRTSGTANVNGPSGDQKHAAKQKSDRDRLNEIAVKAGYTNWSQLQSAALRGVRIVIG